MFNWCRYPSIFIAIAIATGIASSLFSMFYLTVLIAFPRQIIQMLVIALSCFFATELRVQLPKGPVSGCGHFSIEQISARESGHSRGWFYKGVFYHFASCRNVPVTIFIPHYLERPLGNCDYFIRGTLIPTESGGVCFKYCQDDPWYSIPSTHSFAEWRLDAKKWLSRKIRSLLHHEDSASFLIGITTGEFDDPMLQFDFSRFGLQHIMAISGFHFSLMTSFFSTLLFFIFSGWIRLSSGGLLLLLSFYFFFLGHGPSVSRAFISMIIGLSGTFLSRETSGLNNLGTAVILLLIYDPLLIQTLGFNFSVLTTASILLYFPLFDLLFTTIFKVRTVEDITKHSFLEQISYVVLSWVRQSLALTCAVNLIAIPLTLFYFGRFPALSLVYNLFFPFLTSISMTLCFLGFFLRPLEGFIFFINDYFTHWVILLTSNLPTRFDLLLEGGQLSSPVLILILLLLFYFPMLPPRLSIILSSKKSFFYTALIKRV